MGQMASVTAEVETDPLPDLAEAFMAPPTHPPSVSNANTAMNDFDTPHGDGTSGASDSSSGAGAVAPPHPNSPNPAPPLDTVSSSSASKRAAPPDEPLPSRKSKRTKTAGLKLYTWCFCGESQEATSRDDLAQQMVGRTDVIQCSKPGCETDWVRISITLHVMAPLIGLICSSILSARKFRVGSGRRPGNVHLAERDTNVVYNYWFYFF